MRRRTPLRVNTFPFLAVLLCAMGALILILLVMDRRARLAALARAREAAQQQSEARGIARETRRREQASREELARSVWNRRRAQLAARLQAEQRALDAEALRVQSQLAAVAAELKAEGDSAGKLRGELRSERGRLETQEAALRKAREEMAGAKTRLTAADRARHKLAADLVGLEQVLRDLQAARRREAMTYSVIPYKGKTGESRRPLYIECTTAGFLFHPDRFELPAPSPEALRDEVTRRTKQTADRRRKAGLKEERPYLMLLVRPGGIEHYYELQSAIQGTPAEFGYEFVDADWVLTIPPEDDTIAGATDSSAPAKASSDRGPSLPLPGGDEGPALASGSGTSAGGGAPPRSEPLAPSEKTHRVGRFFGTQQTDASAGPEASPPVPRAPSEPLPLASSSPSPAGPPSGRPELALQGSAAGPSGGLGAGLLNGSSADSAPAPAGLAMKPTVAAATQGPHRAFGTDAGGRPGGLPGGGAGASPQPGVTLFPLPAPGSAPGITPGVAVRPAQPAPAPPGPPGPSGPPVPRKDDSAIRVPSVLPGSVAASAGPATASPLSTGATAGGTTAGGAAAPQGGGHFRGQSVQGPGGPAQPAPLLPARVRGFDDTVVFIECLSDGVVVHPGGRSIPIDALNHSPAHNPLYQAVKARLVLHRGDPRRCQLRFLVHRDAERTYHLAYPAFNGLAIDKTRYTLRPDDDVSRLIAAD